MPNTAAKQVILHYLNTPKPGYALLVDAPWGSGKTHTVNRILTEMRPDPADT